LASRPINVAFIWHMHQPFYKDVVTGEYVLPWVRLHAIKDYYDMAAILDNFPNIKQTFNLVPSLLEQIDEYVKGIAVDRHLALTIKKAADLTDEDRSFILQNFFMANWDTMVIPYKRFFELLLKRGRFVSHEEVKTVAKRFSDQEMLDLQVWFNLTWFGHIYKTNDPLVRGLLEKGRDFTEEEKLALIEKQKEIMQKVIQKYKELMEKKQIEVSVTPYYHPILPLLVDTNAAKESIPGIALPLNRFRHPEDAKFQIDEAVKYATQLLGAAPLGMWPSEGSVSEEIIPLIASAGIKWIATDEEILSMSFGKGAGGDRKLNNYELFKPYKLERGDSKLNIIFRDHALSDLIGFIYSKWNPKDAANDFVGHLNNIRSSLPDDREYLVSIILDGENAWEYYSNNGWDFLSELYAKISEDPNIKTVRICDFLEQNPPQDGIGHLFAGSWINHNFRIWIGHEEDNKAWDYLSKARLALAAATNADPKAWKELYIAEGSDWCWWYGDDHSSGNDDMFDMLFRKHLKNIYQLIGKPSPQYLDQPIKQVTVLKPTREPAYIITPVIDGEETNFYEWLAAGYYDISKLKGAMHQAETVVRSIYYGFDITHFHVRLDVNLDMKNSECKHFTFNFLINAPHSYKISTFHDEVLDKCIMKVFKAKDEQIEAQCGDRIEMVISVEKDGQELERWPRGGCICFEAPACDYEQRQWNV
jgi:alpha-amylase/alpha-mannosidase (GH57 family)